MFSAVLLLRGAFYILCVKYYVFFAFLFRVTAKESIVICGLAVYSRDLDNDLGADGLLTSLLTDTANSDGCYGNQVWRVQLTHLYKLSVNRRKVS